MQYIRRILAVTLCLLCICCACGTFGTCGAENAQVPLIQFLAGDAEPADLSKAAELRVYVNHCMYAEPLQSIIDPEIVKKTAYALRAITVTADHDQVSSTETYYGYGLYDADGAYILGAEFQSGMLMRNEGRYPVTGLDALLDIEGILLADDWQEYWELDEQIEDTYLYNLEPTYPAQILALRGYAASQLREEDILFVDIYISDVDEAGRLSTDDPETIRRVFSALNQVQATGPAPEDGDGLTYYVTLYYADAALGITRSVWLKFEGDRLQVGEQTYALSGIDKLFEIENAEVLNYLKAHYMD